MSHPMIELIDRRHEEVAAVINRLRTAHGYTIAKLAEEMEIPYRTLEGKTLGRYRFTVGELYFLANLFGLSLSDLLQDPDNL